MAKASESVQEERVKVSEPGHIEEMLDYWMVEWDLTNETIEAMREDLREYLVPVVSTLAKCVSDANRLQIKVDELQSALDKHLCPYDKADWIGCAGHLDSKCEVCAAADTGQHRHALLKRAERAEEMLTQVKAYLDERTYDQRPADLSDAIAKVLRED